MTEQDLKLLSDVVKGTPVVLHSIMGGDDLTTRLSSLGLVAGVEFRLLDKCRQGEVMLLIGESRLALGAGIAGHLWVSESGEAP